MADYTIFADISSYLLETLRKKMCPEPIPTQNGIEIVTPMETDLDHLLGIYLYDILEEGDVARPSFIRSGREQLTKPPKSYSLYYMIFVNGASQMGIKASDIQKILGKAAQVINDHGYVQPNQLQSWLSADEPPVVFTQASITLDEKVRVWQAIDKPYQVSLFYKAAPALLSSDIVVTAKRVSDASFRIGLKGKDATEREEG